MMKASAAEGREQVDASALLRAAGEGDAAGVESLLAAGADVNAAPESGETALIRAASKGRLQVVRTLLAAGADTNAEREDGFTALGVAVFFGHADIVRALLAGGADPNAKGRLGATAERWALFNGFEEIVEMLRNPDRARDATSEAADDVNKGATVYFPNEGTFSPVVPLSKIDESSPPHDTSHDASSEVDDAAQAVDDESVVGVDNNQEPIEQEVVTLIRARKHAATAPLPTHAVRAKGSRRSWLITAGVLCLSLIAGVATGVYLLGSWRSAERRQLSPPVEEAARAVDAGTQSTESQSSTPTPDVQASQPAAQLPETSLTAQADSSTPTRGATADADEDGSSANGKDVSAKSKDASKSASSNAPRVTASENVRARGADVAARRDAREEARASRAAPVVAERVGDARREAAQPRRARRTEGRVQTSSPRDNSLPVFSPTPSANAEKSKVIPWP